ncbi:MAG: DUF1554 domain-containing protein [Bdellovibrionia bacterium]
MYKKLAILGLGAFVLSACSGDGGGSGGATATKFIFYTAAKTNGNLAGLPAGVGGALEKADAFCEADSNKPNSSTYKAMITTGSRRACTSANCSVGGATENTQWIMTPNTNYKRADGTIIGTTNSAGIIVGDLTEDLGGTNAVDFAWTGLTSGWETDSNNCVDWISTGGDDGAAGGLADINDSWFSGYSYDCGQSMSLICVEQ